MVAEIIFLLEGQRNVKQAPCCWSKLTWILGLLVKAEPTTVVAAVLVMCCTTRNLLLNESQEKLCLPPLKYKGNKASNAGEASKSIQYNSLGLPVCTTRWQVASVFHTFLLCSEHILSAADITLDPNCGPPSQVIDVIWTSARSNETNI